MIFFIQLSLCPSSLLGLPPLTLAISCSAGITAAAATVGVHLLQLDPPSSGSEQAQQQLHHPQKPEGFPASASSSSFLILPNPNFRRPSSESQMSNSSQQYLHVPGAQPCTTTNNSSILLPSTTTNTKRASFLSLYNENEQQQPIEGVRRKRISFNLPASEYQKEVDDNNVPNGVVRNRSLTNGHSMKEADIGFGQRLRRSFLLTLAAANSRAAKDWVEEDDDGNTLNNIANGKSDCPGKALLNMQKQHDNSSTSEGTIRRGRKLSSALARALLTKLAAATDIKRQVDPEKMDSTGSSESVQQRKMCALKTETNFAGWAAYC